MSSSPVFGSEDRIDPATGLPESLKGKTPAEVAKYYQERESNIIANARRAIATAGAGPTPPPPGPTPPTPKATITREDLYNNPQETFNKFQSGLITKEEFLSATAPFQKTIIAMAENLASQGKKYWNKYRDEILGIMAHVTPDQQASVSSWNVAYNTVVGIHWEEIEKEAVKIATTPASEGVQTPSATPTAPVDLKTLTFKEGGKNGKIKTAEDVVSGLNISPDNYRDAMKKIDEGTFPGLTLDNRGR